MVYFILHMTHYTGHMAAPFGGFLDHVLQQVSVNGSSSGFYLFFSGDRALAVVQMPFRHGDLALEPAADGKAGVCAGKRLQAVYLRQFLWKCDILITAADDYQQLGEQ